MPAEAEPFYEPISLGYSCEAKYQIARVAKGRLHPKQSEMAFRFAISQGDHASSVYGWRLFDWQNTPLETVCDYIERDFEGVFEREDFEATFDYGVPADGGAVNARFETVYIREFFPVDPAVGRITKAQIQEHYPSARRRFEDLVSDFRTLLTLPGPYLYTIAHPTYPEASTLNRLIGLLSSRSPDHQFQLLVVGRYGHDSDLSALGNRVAKAWRRPVNPDDKPPHLAWEGDDASWDEALAPYRLGFHKLGFHDPTAPQPGSGEPTSSGGARSLHAQFPSPQAKVVWEQGPAAVYTNNYWRGAGAQLETDAAGAALITPPIAWHYSHAVKLDFDQIDFDQDHAWVRVVLEDVGGGRLLASLFDVETNALAEEALADQGPGPVEIFLKVRERAKNFLMFRTGADAQSAHARVTKVQLLRDRG
jgi:hypothetical protein